MFVVMVGMCMPFKIDDAIYDECGEGATVDGRVRPCYPIKTQACDVDSRRAGANWASVGARPVTEGCTSHTISSPVTLACAYVS